MARRNYMYIYVIISKITYEITKIEKSIKEKKYIYTKQVFLQFKMFLNFLNFRSFVRSFL